VREEVIELLPSPEDCKKKNKEFRGGCLELEVAQENPQNGLGEKGGGRASSVGRGLRPEKGDPKGERRLAIVKKIKKQGERER